MSKKKSKFFCLALGNMKINHYLCGIIASINKIKIDFFNQLPLGTKAQKEEATEKVRALIEPLILLFYRSAVAAKEVCRTCRGSRTMSPVRTQP